MLDIPLETWPEHMPNVAQARHLIKAGVPEPLIATLTRIGTVEGYGANIRLLQPGDMQKHFQEDIRGTAIDHLGKGLFEAHGRDEAGWEEEAGHKDMWFAARDVAFENPTAKIDIDAMLARMGFGQPGGPGGHRRGAGAARRHRHQPRADRQPHDPGAPHRDPGVPHLRLGRGVARRPRPGGRRRARRPSSSSYIRADETPHVEYLKTALTEMRDRTWVGASGKTYAGTDMIGTLWNRGLDQSLGDGRQQTRKAVLGEVEHWCLQHDGGADILAEFHSLATAHRRRRLTPARRRRAHERRPRRRSERSRRSAARLRLVGRLRAAASVVTSSTRPSGPSIVGCGS